MDFNGTFTQSLDALLQRVTPSLVVVRGHRWGAGAGIVWREDGMILTNNHVVGRHAPLVILGDDSEHESRLVARDPHVDLALLSIGTSDLTPLQNASVPTRIGEMVFSFGHPFGQRNSVTQGIVSAILTAKTRRGKEIPVVRSDAPLAPGNSGGPMVNAQGEVIGINTMIIGGDQNIAIHVSVVKDFVERKLSDRETHRAKPVLEDVL